MNKKLKITGLKAVILVLLIAATSSAGVDIIDSLGQGLHFDLPPRRVVSIVPSVTEVICNLGAADALVGVTFHSSLPYQKNDKAIVGGFSFPSLDKIRELNPDLVFVSSFQEKIRAALTKAGLKTLCLDTASYDQGMKNIEILAQIFDRQEKGRELVCAVENDIALITQKLGKLEGLEKKRVFRLMGRDKIMTPTARAFLNQLVIRAGGIPMAPQGEGMVAQVSLEQWKKFNPQVIFGCGEDKKAAEKYLSLPGWKDVDAVKNNRILYFPCELTCRISSCTGYFIQWLAASIYREEFFRPENQVYPDGVLTDEAVPIHQKLVKESHRVTSHIADFKHKTLVIDFTTPQEILSTLEGFRTGVGTVANHYLPPPSWSMPHGNGLEDLKLRILAAVKRNPASSALLMTGADMDHVTITDKQYRDMIVTAVVTAGVCSNAQRASCSTGHYYEPGTINIILMTNMKLSHRAMARAVISITEAKSAVLADLDIRSTDDPLNFQATGTGTDNIIVVQGQGTTIDGTGGHTKMGELIAKAVYDGVKQAIFFQNGLLAQRNVFQRLEERNISLYSLAGGFDCECSRTGNATTAAELETLLLKPEYAGMVEQAFALSDALERGQLSNLTAFSYSVKAAADKIANRPINEITSFKSTRFLPQPLEMVFNALMSAIEFQVPKYEENMENLPVP